MRVTSERPCKNGGWLHPINDRLEASPTSVRQWQPTATDHPDFSALMADWRRSTDDARLSWAARSLGVTFDSLKALGTVQSGPHTLAFPMSDGDGRVIGIRLRAENGKKWAVKGSHNGLFASTWPASATAYICEGPTDTAAALSIGLWAVGRPSCSSNNAQLKTMLAFRGVKNAVILADNDPPGVNGAQRLASEIRIPCALLVLPAKDARDFVARGGTRLLVENLLRQTLWRNP